MKRTRRKRLTTMFREARKSSWQRSATRSDQATALIREEKPKRDELVKFIAVLADQVDDLQTELDDLRSWGQY